MTVNSKSRRVLIIDRDNVRRGMLACTLPAHLFSLEFASTPEKGLDLLSSVQPQIVIVGNDRDAVDFCQRIRALPAGSTFALLLMDERFRDANLGKSESDAAGADSYLPFPFEVELLENRLKATSAGTLRSMSLLSDPSGAQTPQPKPDHDDEHADAWQRFGQLVDQIHDQLDTVDYYQLLRVDKNSASRVIKEAYFYWSLHFHPDRFMRLSDDVLRMKIYDIFKRMSEAFKVLINPEARSRYDENLAGPERETSLRYLEIERTPATSIDPTAEAVTAVGKRYLHFATLAESDGNHRSAMKYLTQAIQVEPENQALKDRLEQVKRKLG